MVSRLGGKLGSGPDPLVEGRIWILVFAIVLVFGIFEFRLFQLQIILGEELLLRSERNSIRTLRLEAPRGVILDRNGRVLATTRPAFGVQIIPSDVRDVELELRALSQLLGLDLSAHRERLENSRGRSRFQPIRIATDISSDQRAKVESHRFNLPGVITDLLPRRHYVEGDLAAHLLGKIGEIQAEQLQTRNFQDYRAGEIIGQSGVEAMYERVLRGKAGGRNVIVDVAGREGEVLDQVWPEEGGQVVLAIDIDLQRAAEEGFLEVPEGEVAKMGALVALDPRNGDVLALVSKPAFDPNDFAGGVDATIWRGLTTDEWRPLQHRSLRGQYPPGSTYKAFVAAAGLEEGLITPETTVYCPGHYRLGRRTYRCWKRRGHGEVNLHKALRESCDVYFYTLGYELGIDRMAYFSRAFGLGARTEMLGIQKRDENAGLIPTKAWKERRFKEKWVGGETISASIGQGFNLVTPVQMAVAFSAIANGGRIVRPRLVLNLVDQQEETEEIDPSFRGRVPIKEEYLNLVRKGLEAVVHEPHGTGGRARVPGVRVAGKTGTAQVVRLEKTEDMDEKDIPIRYRDHAWFVSYAPAENPEIVVSVLVEHGGHGGSAAAPIAQRVLARYFEKKAEQEAPAEVEPSEEENVRN